MAASFYHNNVIICFKISQLLPTLPWFSHTLTVSIAIKMCDSCTGAYACTWMIVVILSQQPHIIIHWPNTPLNRNSNDNNHYNNCSGSSLILSMAGWCMKNGGCLHNSSVCLSMEFIFPLLSHLMQLFLIYFAGLEMQFHWTICCFMVFVCFSVVFDLKVLLVYWTEKLIKTAPLNIYRETLVKIFLSLMLLLLSWLPL